MLAIITPIQSFYYLSMAAMGLRCCVQAVNGGCSLITVQGFLTVVASRVAEHGL